MRIKAKTHWVWTQKAADRYGYVPGSPTHEEYLKEAPKQMHDDGFIIDSTEYTGQTDLFSALEG